MSFVTTRLRHVSDTPGLEDGSYEAFIVDADRSADGAMHLDVVITTGEHKGFVVSVVTGDGLGDEFELMGVPAVLFVTAGRPSVRLDL